ncbi:diguanylate cyclase [Helicobacter sp. 13S00477-4]|uniref:diguanylate cyclase n=1 Tax=Helicobacter sp. 13S00477-4 TaxID=1905759 RepID=UPI000BA5A68C|nr:diguanylate cyclase [Helicobacter sp. 13S00477-4]PAF52209.1 hypothetical protein BKH44_03660 [Helicobacter sp. 13S00477-4]
MAKIIKEEPSDFGSNIFFGKLDPNNIETNQNDSFEIEDQITKKVSEIAYDTVKQLEQEDLPAFPGNYQLYFERLLEKEEASFRQKIENVIDLQSITEERAVTFEKNVKDGFKNIKHILDFIAILYKNLQLMQSITDKHVKGIEKIDNKIALNSAIELFVKDIEKVNSITASQLDQIKDLYQKTSKIISDINQSTIYDSRFGIYNKRYFMNLIERENKIMEEFTHSSSVLVMALSKNIQDDSDKATQMVLFKSIAKLLLKNSRRSDIIGYLGDGIFGVGLKYSNIESATKATERFVQSIKATSLFLGDKDISLEVSVGVAKISPQRNAQDSLNAALSALQNALDEKISYKIFPGDEV